GILTARITNSGEGTAYNVRIDLPLIENAAVSDAAGGTSKIIEVLAPNGGNAECSWTLTFSSDLLGTDVLGQLQSLSPMMEGEQGEWVQAPVSHEFRTEHDIDDLINQVDELADALENKVENEFSHLAHIYSETEDIINEMADLGQLQLVTETMNKLISVVYSMTDLIFKVNSFGKDVSGDLTEGPDPLNYLQKTTDQWRKQAAVEMQQQMDTSGKPKDTSYYDAVKSMDITGITGVGDAIVKLNSELLGVIELYHTQAQIKQDLKLNLSRLAGAAINTTNAPTADDIRKQLEYSSVDSRKYYRRLMEYMEWHDNLPESPQDYQQIRRLSDEIKLKGLDMYLSAIKALRYTMRSQLQSLKYGKQSAIFPVDLLFQELHSMTATLVTYDPGTHSRSSYEPNIVETPGLETDEDRAEVFWYALGTTSPYNTPILEEHEFGEVKELLLRSYDHLQMQWDNIAFHAETLAEYNELSMSKFAFDSMGMIGGMGAGILGESFGHMFNAVKQVVDESMELYKQALGSMKEAERIGLRILYRDIRDVTKTHQKEAGTVWTFMRDFSGHVQYLLDNRPIDPVLSVEVLSFEIADAPITEEGGMGLTPGVITLKNNGTLDWSGLPVINIYSDGEKILTLELPNIELAAGEEGTRSFTLLLPDAQTYSLFGFDFELTLELWEEETLSRASYGPWVTMAQSGTEDRLNRLSGSIPTHLRQQPFGDEEMHTETYTATQDG
ncbi:MAG TPA: hypothetical protein VJ904_02980, partial [Tichowtungia sp.]|nr:hypothetical protein [Tichowtungia sp.]